MAWLTSLLNRSETIDKEADPSAQDAAVEEEGAAPPPGGPPLALLAPDIAGISSFQLRFFPDAATAASELEQSSPEVRRGTHAFWALHRAPDLPPEAHCEALVLIRANLTSDVVYAVSFIDLESAWSFARFEAKRGLDVSHLIILWAAFATVREELDGVSVLPQSPPATKDGPETISPPATAVELEATETVREYERREELPISDTVAAPEAPKAPDSDEQTKLAEAEAARPAEMARRQAAEEAERRAEAARRQAAEEAEQRAEAARRQAAEEATRIAEQAQERLRAARAAADAARAQAEVEAARRREAERRLEEQRLAAEAAARASVLADMKSRIESAQTIPEPIAEEPVVLDATSGALEGLAEASTQPSLADRPRTIEAVPAAESHSGDEETPTGQPFADEEEPVARGTVFAHAPAIPAAEDAATVEVPGQDAPADDARDADDDAPKVPELDDFDIAYEVARLLENRRWDKREEPFQGFDSPPGKF
ncbi:MAG TPA: hypothetical protein VIW01_10215 [Dehalococcoidia bacterium]